MKKLAVGVFILVLLLAFATSSFAAVNLKGGTYFRLRHEYYKNYKDMENSLKDNRNYFRIKSSLWGQADFSKEISLYGKLTNEFRTYTYYYQTTSRKKRYYFDINEICFDNLYLDVKNFLKYPVDLRIGRQDLSGYGENFMLADGTPGDGGRTYYYNAFKASWRADKNNTLEFIYTRNPRDDVYLPILNEDKSPQNLTTTAEEGYILYWKNKELVKNLNLEGYYIYKREDDEYGTGYQAQKGRINALGSFAKYNLAPYVLRGQFAYQFGKYGEEDRRGIGGYAFVDRDFKKVLWSPQASLGFVYLSGDDKGTTKNEGWDPLFSRSPWMSEVYAININAETGINAYWTNLQIFRTSLVLNPTKKAKLSVLYNFLRANELPGTTSNNISNSGKKRGHLPQARIDYTFNKNVAGYFLIEYFIPGNFYVNEADESLFLRTELTLKF